MTGPEHPRGLFSDPLRSQMDLGQYHGVPDAVGSFPFTTNQDLKTRSHSLISEEVTTV